jgi:hypothetical protein
MVSRLVVDFWGLISLGGGWRFYSEFLISIEFDAFFLWPLHDDLVQKRGR